MQVLTVPFVTTNQTQKKGVVKMKKLVIGIKGFGVKKFKVVCNNSEVLVINFFGTAIIYKKWLISRYSSTQSGASPDSTFCNNKPHKQERKY